jgi:hypothetical protein
MPRPEHAFERAGEFLDLDPRLVPGRVELVDRGREEEVDAGVLGDGHIALLVARIALEILRGIELGGVHEQAYDDRIALVASSAEKREVPFVEGSHRRDEPDRAVPQRRERVAQLRDRANLLHEVTSASAW